MFNIDFKSVLKTSLDKLTNRVSTLNTNNTNNTNIKVNDKVAEEVSELELHTNLKNNWRLIENNNNKLNLLAQEISTKLFLLNHTQSQFKLQSNEFLLELNNLPELIRELNSTTLNMIGIQDKLNKLDDLLNWIEGEEKSIQLEDWKIDKEKELEEYFKLTRKNYNEKMDFLNSQLLSNYNINNQSTLLNNLPASDFRPPKPLPSSATSTNLNTSNEDPIQKSKLDLDSFYSDIPSDSNSTLKPVKNQLNSTNFSSNFNTSDGGNNLIAQDEDYPE